MNSKAAHFELDESMKNLKNDEQPLRITDVLYEDDLMLLEGICAQLYYSNVDIYRLQLIESAFFYHHNDHDTETRRMLFSLK